jgi:hypothetical protein
MADSQRAFSNTTHKRQLGVPRASSGLATSKWVWADQFPAMALESLAAFVGIQRLAEMLDHLFEVMAGRRGIEEQW